MGLVHNVIISMSNIEYEFSIPLFLKALGGLKNVLAKAKALPVVSEQGDAALLTYALAPDMFPFVKQVQMACDNAKGIAGRLAGVPVPVMEDNETTLAALETRIDATVAFLQSLTPEQFDGAAMRKITLPYFPNMYMDGGEYLRQYGIPNFYFHVTTAYAIVRTLGGAVGKADYLNGLPLKPETETL